MNSQISETRSASLDFSSLSPEILLPIFLNLTSEEIVLFRRVCKKWLDVINTNKSLWRNLEWIGKSGESIEKAIDLFDEKSASSLEMISIEEGIDLFRGLQKRLAVVGRSEASLKSISVLIYHSAFLMPPLLDLANYSPNLERLILWDANEPGKQYLPLTHLVRNRKRFDADSSASRLKVLWLPSSGDAIEQILLSPIESLISFALPGVKNFQHIRPLLAKFSETIAHLRLSILTSVHRMEQPLFCSNLKILEGFFHINLSLYFDCPNLKHLIFSFGHITGLGGIPSSVEQLWFKSNGEMMSDEFWEPLLSSCPNMRVLKLEEEFSSSGGGSKAQIEKMTQVLEKRQEMIKRGEPIQGLVVVPLRKLILPLKVLSEDQLGRATKVVGEVIDVQDCTDFIELRY